MKNENALAICIKKNAPIGSRRVTGSEESNVSHRPRDDEPKSSPAGRSMTVLRNLSSVDRCIGSMDHHVEVKIHQSNGAICHGYIPSGGMRTTEIMTDQTVIDGVNLGNCAMRIAHTNGTKHPNHGIRPEAHDLQNNHPSGTSANPWPSRLVDRCS